MTIGAAGRGPVTKLLPRGEVLAHDVAVGAHRGIGAQIRRTLGVDKREDAESKGSSQQGRYGGRQRNRAGPVRVRHRPTLGSGLADRQEELPLSEETEWLT